MENHEVLEAMKTANEPVVSEIKSLRKQTEQDFAAIQTTLDEHGQRITKLDERVSALESSSARSNSNSNEAEERASSVALDSTERKGFGYSPRRWSEFEERSAIINSTALKAAREVTRGSFQRMLKAILEKDHATIKTLVGGTDSAGGFLVPVEHMDVIAEISEQYGVARSTGANVIPMASDEMNVPKLLTDVSASWSAENATTGESDAAFSQKKLLAKRMRLWTEVTKELLMDSSPKIEAYLLKIFARAIAKKEDEAVFNGTGSGASNPHTGILNVAGTSTQASAGSTLTYTDLTALESKLTGGQLMGARLYATGKGIKHLRNLRDSQNMPILVNAIAVEGLTSLWNTYPVVRVEAGIPDNLGSGADETRYILGNMEHVWIGEREPLAISSSEEFKFTSDVIVVKATLREGITVVNPEGFAILTGIVA